MFKQHVVFKAELKNLWKYSKGGEKCKNVLNVKYVLLKPEELLTQ